MRYTTLVGVDEAGRGPLAGPVAVGAFAALPGFDVAQLTSIRDSKVASEAEREAWYAKLTHLPNCRWAVAQCGAGYIDRHGIVRAVTCALDRALAALELDPSTTSVFLDGSLRAPHKYHDQTTIIRGDSTVPVIQAAAILAKVTRDRLMVRMAKHYPAYGFAAHKGYGTKAHRDAIMMHGLCNLHRMSFCKGMIQAKGQNAEIKSAIQT